MTMGHQNGESTRDSAAIRDSVEARFPEMTVDDTVVYDLTAAPVSSQPAHGSSPR